jgi:16S rRNA (cytosine967-C5)-methyltransferase
MGAENVRVHAVDGREIGGRHRYDRVLIDPPCSGLGTLQSRPDLRWQRRRSELPELRLKQESLLAAGARALSPRGTLVYSVCTISRTEADDLIDAFLEGRPEFVADERRQLLPHRDGTDGFYIARLTRR